ncbi:MAG: radical SAM protein [Candidatus Paceibacterota bacterium]|jgi:radical SAM protein with 4Fe4S-binding SPASM domain
MYRTLKSPLNIQVELTQQCNVVCRHCYNYFRHKNDPKYSLTKSDIDKMVEEFQKNQVMRGVITGGEPLKHSRLAIYLAQKMTANNMRVTLNSNLSLFTEEIGRELKEVNVKAFLVSLIADDPKIHDWVTQKPGSHQQTIAGIKLAVGMGFRILINMVLTNWNIDRVQQTGDLVGSLGVNKFGATRACAPGPIAVGFTEHLISIENLRRSLDILDHLKQKWGYEIDVFEHYPWCALSDVRRFSHLARRKCTAGITSASIGADGQLRPCGHSSRVYGSVLEEGLKIPWMRMTDWREQVYSQACSDCKYFRLCTGGCPVEAGNSKTGKDHHCTDQNDVISLPEKEEYPIINSDLELKIPNSVVLREEEFGGIIGSGSGGNSLVDHKTFNILVGLRHQTSFSARSVSVEYELDLSEITEFFSRLKFQNLIQPKEVRT